MAADVLVGYRVDCRMWGGIDAASLKLFGQEISNTTFPAALHSLLTGSSA
jgi:hypothetical protein